MSEEGGYDPSDDAWENFDDNDWNLVKQMTSDYGSYSYEIIEKKLKHYCKQRCSIGKLKRWIGKIHQVRKEWSEHPEAEGNETNISKVKSALNKLEKSANNAIIAEGLSRESSGGRRTRRRRTRRKKRRKSRKSRRRKRRKSRKKSRRRRRR